MGTTKSSFDLAETNIILFNETVKPERKIAKLVAAEMWASGLMTHGIAYCSVSIYFQYSLVL